MGAVFEVISLCEEMVICESYLYFSNPSDCPRNESNAKQLHGVMRSSKILIEIGL
jgi:hypothetical protein